MKKLLLLLVIVGIALFFYFRSDGGAVNTDNSESTGNVSQPDPSNASFIFEDGEIKLSGGKSDNEEVTLLEERAYGDINGDKKSDTVVFLASSGGGSGVFIYAGAFVSGPVNYKGTNAIFLGDRIAPQTISINNGTVTVYYLDRKEDEPYSAEPTVSSSKKFVYKNGELQESL